MANTETNPGTVTPPEAGQPAPHHLVSLDFIDWILLSAVVLVLAGISAFLVSNMNSQNQTYNQIIDHLMSVSTIRKFEPYNLNGKMGTDTLSLVDPPVNAAILSFARAKDFANIKLGSTLLGFLLIFVGSLYLLKVFNLGYKASLSQPTLGDVSIQTTSPGLVMITLGVLMTITALLSHNDINYSVPVAGNALLPPADTLAYQTETPPEKKTTGNATIDAMNEIAALKKQVNDLHKRISAQGQLPGMATSVSDYITRYPLNGPLLYKIPDRHPKVIPDAKVKQGNNPGKEPPK